MSLLSILRGGSEFSPEILIYYSQQRGENNEGRKVPLKGPDITIETD